MRNVNCKNIYLLVLFLIFGLIGCTGEQSNLEQAGEIVKEQAERLNPSLRAKPLKFSGVYTPLGSGNKISSCACLQVCDGNGENCTACSCDPSGCGTC